MRTFVGTLLSNYTQEYYRAVVADLISEHGHAVRSIPDASAHLTYVFLGNIDEGQQQAVRVAVHGVTTVHHGIRIQCGAPRVLWAGRTPRLICAEISEGAAALRRLSDSLLVSLRQTIGRHDLSGMTDAHITLARFRRQATRTDAHAVDASLRDPRYSTGLPTEHVESVQIIASTLTPEGSVYDVLESHPLRVGS